MPTSQWRGARWRHRPGGRIHGRGRRWSQALADGVGGERPRPETAQGLVHMGGIRRCKRTMRSPSRTGRRRRQPPWETRGDVRILGTRRTGPWFFRRPRAATPPAKWGADCAASEPVGVISRGSASAVPDVRWTQVRRSRGRRGSRRAGGARRTRAIVTSQRGFSAKTEVVLVEGIVNFQGRARALFGGGWGCCRRVGGSAVRRRLVAGNSQLHHGRHYAREGVSDAVYFGMGRCRGCVPMKLGHRSDGIGTNQIQFEARH